MRRRQTQASAPIRFSAASTPSSARASTILLRQQLTASGLAETFDGGAGNDTIDGRGGFDRAVYNADNGTASGISVDMAAGTVIGDASIGTDTLISIESVRGTNFADTYVATGFNGASHRSAPGTGLQRIRGDGW